MKLTLKPATTALVVLSILVTLIGMWPGMLEVMLPAGGFIPGRFFLDNDELAAFAGSLPVWITPFTANFIHVSIFDLLFPCLLLMLLGSKTEEVLDWQGILALYVSGIIASAIAIVIFASSSLAPFTGSFNAVSAIIAAYLVLYPVAALKSWGSMSPETSRILQLLLLWFLINLAMVFLGSFSGSLGDILIGIAPRMAGFAAGLLLARPLLRWKYRNA